MSAWIGVDLDGTLASLIPISEYTGNPDQIGKPVPLMIERVRKWLVQGREVGIFTARAENPMRIAPIEEWLIANGLPELAIINVKDSNMIELWDDRCYRIETNTGKVI